MDYAELQAALERRLAVVADREFYQRDPAGHLAALQKASTDLEGFVTKLPADVDPALKHYFERQSYTKALDFLRALPN